MGTSYLERIKHICCRHSFKEILNLKYTFLGSLKCQFLEEVKHRFKTIFKLECTKYRLLAFRKDLDQ